MSNSDLRDQLKALAAGNPKLGKMLEDAMGGGFEKASKARERIKKLTEEMGREGYSQEQVLYGLTVSTVLIAYIFNWGDRAKARDMIARAIDNAMDGIDKDARANGLHETLTEYSKAKEAGDHAAASRVIRRTMESGKTFGFEY
jgi:hypothetical protein